MKEENIETRVIQKSGGGMVIQSYIPQMIPQFLNYQFAERLTEAMVEKAVKVLWKKHGTKIIKMVDKKTIGNMTVKKLSTLIAQELKVK